MARKLSKDQLAELAEFVNALGEAAGYTTRTSDWARDSGYPASNLSDLRNGKVSIDGYNLLRLVRAAAEKAEKDPAALALSEASRSGGEPTNADLALLLEVLSIGVTEGLARLGADVSLEEIQQRLEEERGQG